jgi:hypothetical protein
MFIRFFKTNSPSAFIFIPLIAIAIGGFGFLSPKVLQANQSMPLYELIANPLSYYSWLGNLIALLLIIGEAFLLNFIVNENEILNKQSFLPALFYIVLMGNNSTMLQLHPLLFSNLFILFAINKLISSYRKDNAYSQAFDAGFLISIASLFYFPYIAFFPILGVGFILFRPFNWREWVISFIGVLVPYLFVLTYYFWNDSLGVFIHDKILFSITSKKIIAAIPSTFYFPMTVGCMIVLFSLVKLIGGIPGGSQKSKKGIVLSIWLALFASVCIVLSPEISSIYFSPLAIPISVFCANYFLNIKKEWFGEVLFLLLIGSVFYNLVQSFF